MLPRMLCWLQGALALLLGIQSVVVATLIVWLDHYPNDAGGRFQLVRVVDHDFVWHMGIDTRWIILACLALSACAQSLALVLRDGRWLRPMRWLETAVCMPTATMAVAVEAGVRDVYAIEMLFGLAWCAQLLSMCAWRHSDMLPQYAAWCALLMAYGPILDALRTSSSSSHPPPPHEDRTEEERVLVLVVGEFLLAVLTLGVYTYERLRLPSLLSSSFDAASSAAVSSLKSYYYYSAEEDDDAFGTIMMVYPTAATTTTRTTATTTSVNTTTEPALVLLSFLTHTLLCWSVLGPLLAAVD